MTRKTFVLDTNVFLHDPECFSKFPDNNVVIPITVLEELDRMKRFHTELGRNSRRAFQLLDSLNKLGTGDLRNGVTLENKAAVRVQLEIKKDYIADFALSVQENKIIMAAFLLQEKGETVVFVSKDFAARVKAESIGLKAQDYEYLKYSYDQLYRGIRHIELEKHDIDLFFKDSQLSIPDLDYRPNEYCIMTAPVEKSNAIGKYDSSNKTIGSLLKPVELWGIKPLNVEQRCAIDAMLRDDIKLVTLVGPAGTGKTLMALACGMRKVFDEGVYTRILVSRPVVPLGRDIGYLPGTKEEKLFPWMQPIYDNLEYLCESTNEESSSETLRFVMDSKKLEMEAVTFIRGRSLPKMFIIVDEAQNLTPHEVKTIISRAGEGTKVILTGDPTQIDNPYLDKDSNGLTYTVARFAGQEVFGHVFLEKIERSNLAAIAADIL